MQQVSAIFNSESLNKLFPYYILIDKSLKVKGYGKELIKSCKNLKVNHFFFDYWSIKEFKNEFLKANWLLKNIDRKLIITHILKEEISLSGSFVHLNENDDFLFIGSHNFTKKLNVETENNSNDDSALLLKLQKEKAKLFLFQNIIDSTKDAIHVVHENGQMHYINDEAGKRMNKKPEEIQNYTVFDFATDFKEDRQIWYNHIDELKAKSHLTIIGMNANPKKDPNAIPVEVTAKYIHIDGKGFIVTVSRDISERKNNEKKLELQEKKYRNIISNMNLGLLEVDNDGKIIYCNQSFETLSGYSLEEIKNKEALKLFGKGENREVLKNKIEERKKRKTDIYEISTKNKKGENRWWLISGAPNTTENGKVIGSIGIHLDITKQKELEFELEKALIKAQFASKAKETFLANMSHEIRTPLNGIIGMVQALKNEELTNIQKQYVDSAFSASEHLLSLINNVLDVIKIETGEIELYNYSFSFEKVIKDLEHILRNQIEKDKIQFNINTNNIAPKFIGDETRLRQILINVLGNAIKFTDIGEINLICLGKNIENNYQEVEIEVNDTGIGINSKSLKNIFQKFHQEDNETSRKHSGSGLGLAITKEIVDLMNGSLILTSKKGVGTKLKIKLKFKIDNEAALEVENKMLDPTLLSGVKILLVEDNDLNRIVVKQTLAKTHIVLTEVKDGKEAIRLLENEVFDLILMDLQMPIMDGLETTDYIRRNLGLNTPIIALSANAVKSEIDRCLKVGFDDYITKPFFQKTLISTILKHTNKRNKLKKEDDGILYNLDNLNGIALGSQEFINKMIDLFIEITPKTIKEIEEAHSINDYDKIKKIAHRIKPSIDNIGILSLREPIRSIENNEPNSFDIDTTINNVIKNLTKVVLQLREYREDTKS